MRDCYPYLNILKGKKDFLFLTDHGGKDIFKGLRINIREKVKESNFLKRFPEWVVVGCALFFMGLKKKNVVYVTFGVSKSTYLLMSFQKIFGHIIEPKPHVMFDCLWEPREGIWGKIIINVRKYLVNSVVTKCIVYGKKDIETFNKVLGIPKDKLFFLPYHHTLDGFEYDVMEGNYIFSGGTDGRDYDLLLKVCRELSLPLKIATMNKDIINRARNDKLFEVRTVNTHEFREWMAKSRIVVIPWGKSILRTGGHQTMINAMLMGKPLICYNEDIAEGYVENNKTGIVVPYGNVGEFKEKIFLLYNSSEKREKLGRAARQWVIDNKLNQRDWVYKVYELAAYCFYNQQPIKTQITQ